MTPTTIWWLIFELWLSFIESFLFDKWLNCSQRLLVCFHATVLPICVSLIVSPSFYLTMWQRPQWSFHLPVKCFFFLLFFLLWWSEWCCVKGSGRVSVDRLVLMLWKQPHNHTVATWDQRRNGVYMYFKQTTDLLC